MARVRNQFHVNGTKLGNDVTLDIIKSNIYSALMKDGGIGLRRSFAVFVVTALSF